MMINEPKLTKSLKLLAWLTSGGSFTGALIAIINNSEFIPRRAILGSLVLAVVWFIVFCLLILLKVKSDQNARNRLDKRHHLFFIGSIAVLWLPVLFVPFKTQQVEIVLDVSNRMWQEFDKPGMTKFDAAVTGVLDVLSFLEHQNIEVALRLVKGNDFGQCEISPETTLAVDFTKDFDEIRNYLAIIRSNPVEKAPVVSAVDFSIDHYLNERTWDKRFYIYSFLGGNDTCGKKLGVFLTSPKVVENSISSEIFLIVLLGAGEEKGDLDLPNARLDYARTATEVREIVNDNNQLIQVPTPTSTPTSTPSPSDTPYAGGGGFEIPAGVNPAMPTHDSQPANQNESGGAITPLPNPGSVSTSTPTGTHTQTPSFTPSLVPTWTRSLTPSFTPIPPLTSTPTPYILLTGFIYVGTGEGCQALIIFEVSGSQATGHFRVWNQWYTENGLPYDSGYPLITLPVGPNGYQVGLGGNGNPAYYRHKVWFEYEYNGTKSNELDLICPDLTPSP